MLQHTPLKMVLSEDICALSHSHSLQPRKREIVPAGENVSKLVKKPPLPWGNKSTQSSTGRHEVFSVSQQGRWFVHTQPGPDVTQGSFRAAFFFFFWPCSRHTMNTKTIKIIIKKKNRNIFTPWFRHWLLKCMLVSVQGMESLILTGINLFTTDCIN